MKHLIQMIKMLLVIPALCSLNVFAHEECHGVSQIIVQVHDVNYIPGATNGSPVSAQMPLDNANAFNCTRNNGDKGLNYKDLGYTIDAEESGLQTTLSGSHNTPIYRIPGVEGIGFAIGFKEPSWCGDRFTDTAAKGKRVSLCNSASHSQFSQASMLTMKSYIVFYKLPSDKSPLRPGNQPATVSQTKIGTATLLTGDSAAGSQPITDKPAIYLSGLTIKYGSCSVITSRSTINVNMGKVSKNEFHGVGSKAGSKKSFQIQVMCEHDTSVRGGFFGMASAEDKDALALTPQPNSASGIGVALFYGSGLEVAAGRRVPLNIPVDQLPVLTTINAQNKARNMEFQAQYIQTREQIMAGKADTTATFNLVYN